MAMKEFGICFLFMVLRYKPQRLIRLVFGESLAALGITFLPGILLIFLVISTAVLGHDSNLVILMKF